MAGASAFTFKVDDMVQFKDGRNVRVGFVKSLEEPNEEHSLPGYQILFRMNETGQNRLAWWPASDVQAATAPAAVYKVGDAVSFDMENGQAGKIVEVAPMNAGELENQYAVSFKGTNGRTDLAWWPESVLVRTK